MAKVALPYKAWIRTYGVTIRLESDQEHLLALALQRARKGVVGSLEIVAEQTTAHSFGFYSGNKDKSFLQIDGGELLERYGSEHLLLNFESMLRIKVAEYAVGRMFLHAGAVGWEGKAIIFPADSFGGKSTLTAEFVRRGADYYSDDYAVFDGEGLLHPFSRPISIREKHGKDLKFGVREMSAVQIGGKTGVSPIPVGVVWITHYEEGASWKPELLSPGEAVMEMISQTIPIRYAPEFSFKVLKKITSNAILLKCPRSDAREFAGLFLDFVDNKAF